MVNVSESLQVIVSSFWRTNPTSSWKKFGATSTSSTSTSSSSAGASSATVATTCRFPEAWPWPSPIIYLQRTQMVTATVLPRVTLILTLTVTPTVMMRSKRRSLTPKAAPPTKTCQKNVLLVILKETSLVMIPTSSAGMYLWNCLSHFSENNSVNNFELQTFPKHGLNKLAHTVIIKADTVGFQLFHEREKGKKKKGDRRSESNRRNGPT